MKSLVTGATGFVGQQLVQRLDDPVVVGRNIRRLHTLFHGRKAYQWDQPSQPDPSIFTDVDTVFHLAGEPVAKGRWDKKKKENPSDDS